MPRGTALPYYLAHGSVQRRLERVRFGRAHRCTTLNPVGRVADLVIRRAHDAGSRNPTCLSLTIIGCSTRARQIWSLVLAVRAAMNWVAIPFEEARLKRRLQRGGERNCGNAAPSGLDGQAKVGIAARKLS